MRHRKMRHNSVRHGFQISLLRGSTYADPRRSRRYLTRTKRKGFAWRCCRVRSSDFKETTQYDRIPRLAHVTQLRSLRILRFSGFNSMHFLSAIHSDHTSAETRSCVIMFVTWNSIPQGRCGTSMYSVSVQYVSSRPYRGELFYS